MATKPRLAVSLAAGIDFLALDVQLRFVENTAVYESDFYGIRHLIFDNIKSIKKTRMTTSISNKEQKSRVSYKNI